ncbi:Calx-beta domain-containing protein [Vacuolonema iberomarrocanum]|uniref:Calx-beta domain-containing protein n=1 Tax=Vacuolonema iberomarrocanum TaxID=3454632 RepID=UPI0019E3390B|nr:FG-GAP repeat protein [filamentous cyanobacterium LEGE 07170]
MTFPTQFNLSDLDGNNGFILDGIGVGDVPDIWALEEESIKVFRGRGPGNYSSISVSGAGDINGDGFDDFIIGADGAAPNGNFYAGQSYVVFGSDQGFDASLNLSTLDGSDGFVLNGIDRRDYSGGSVSSAGDVNGDGIDDLIIGAAFAEPGRDDDEWPGINELNVNELNVNELNLEPDSGPEAGESYVVFGSRQGFDASLDLADLDGDNGFTLNGVDAYDRSGYSVSNAGDINGDGIDDIIIGTYRSNRLLARLNDAPNESDSGKSYVVFGSDQGFDADFNLADLDGGNGFALNGMAEFGFSGYAVSNAGDMNGDGIDDIIIGAASAAPNGTKAAGQSYIVFGSDQGFDADVNLAGLDGDNGFVLNGIDAFDFAGGSVSSAGDVNGDGIDDIIIGAAGAEPGRDSDDDEFAIQEFNDSPFGNRDAGQSYVVFGSDQGFDASLDLADLDGDNGFVLNGVDAYDRSGYSVSGAGDINGDGFDDIIIGAYRDSEYQQMFELNDIPNDLSSGESYVVYGSDQGFDASLNLADLDGVNGFVLNGIDAFDFSSISVSAAGDINGDGGDDLIIGAPFAFSGIAVARAQNINGDLSEELDGPFTPSLGQGYVLFGTPRPTVSIVATDANAAEAGTEPGTFTITRTGDAAAALTVAYMVAMTSTATNGDDYDTLTGTVEIPAGQDSTTLTISPIDDNQVEGSETVTVELSAIAAYEVDGTASSATVTIADDDTAPVPPGFTPADDDFTGTEGRDVAFALAGNDIVRGLGGSDRLSGEAGNDQLFGGAGNDRLVGGAGNDNLVGGADNDRMLGGTGNDRLVGNTGTDRLIGGNGVDTLLGGSGDDTLIGGAGNDRLSGQGGNDLMRGNLGADVLNGGAGNDRQFGGAGNDRLNGQGGNDVMRGGAGRDVMRGGAGNDRLAGELGNDLIVTGAGRDRIVIRSGQGFDRVTDFSDGQDRIVLGGINFGQLSIQQRNDDVLISQGNERLLLLQNTTVGDISAADFA